jgi:hypothetical protein
MMSRRLLLPAIVLLAAACASSGVDRSSRAASTMQRTTTLVTRSQQQVDATTAALDRLMSSSGTDLKKAFDAYAKQVARSRDVSRDLAEAHKEMIESRDNYFKGWTADAESIQDPELKRIAQERRAALNERAGSLVDAFTGVKQGMDTWLVSLTDIEKFLGNELTDGNVSTLASTAKVGQVKSEGDALKQRLADAERVIADVRMQITPGAMGLQPTTPNP